MDCSRLHVAPLLGNPDMSGGQIWNCSQLHVMPLLGNPDMSGGQIWTVPGFTWHPYWGTRACLAGKYGGRAVRERLCIGKDCLGVAVYWERLSGDSYALGKDAIFADGKVITEYAI